MRWKKGYTLIEILVTLTIIGFLFSFGYVSFRDFSRRQQMAGEIKQIQGDLRLAQEMALAGQKPESSCTRLDGYGFNVYSDTDYKIEANCDGAPGTDINKDSGMPADLTISAPSPNPIIFKVLGEGTNIVASTSATITLTQVSTGRKASVVVTAGGEIK